MAHLTVSVIIPTFNRAHLLSRAIRSAVACIRDGDEIIVVDDGSTDNTAEVVDTFGDRVRFIPLPHAGAGRTRNHAIAAAGKQLIAFLDSDDEWMPDKLYLQRSLMERQPHALFCFSDFSVRTGEGVTLSYLINWHQGQRGWSTILGEGTPFSAIASLPKGRREFSVHSGSLLLAEMRRDYVATSTLVVRREESGDALRFAEDVATFEDWECFGRLAARGQAAFLDCDTGWQHGHAGPRLSCMPDLNKATARLKILERVWGQDAAFLRQHGEVYQELRKSFRLARASCLLHQGLTREAREELDLAGGSPFSHRLLAMLPGGIVRPLLNLRTRLRSLAH